MREANLEEVRSSINEIRNFNIRDTLEKAVDTDGTIRKTFTEDPLKTDYASQLHAAAADRGPAVAGPPAAATRRARLPGRPPHPPMHPPRRRRPRDAGLPVAAAEPPARPRLRPAGGRPADAPAPTQKN